MGIDVNPHFFFSFPHQLEGKYQCQKLGNIFKGPNKKFLLNFMVILDVYRSIIPN